MTPRNRAGARRARRAVFATWMVTGVLTLGQGACRPSVETGAAPADSDASEESGAAGRAAFITSSEAVGWAPLPQDTVIAYGDLPQQFGELRLPEGSGPFPVAVVIHGGCWLSIADNDYVDPLAAALTRAGWATWNLEFRTIDQPGGRWPGIFRDVGSGVDHLREIAGGFALDLDRVVTIGHSSGGHLALWAASRERVPPTSELFAPDPLPLKGAVGLAAIADVEQYDGMRNRSCGDTPRRLLGGTPAPERLAAASPAELAPTGVPQLLLTGEEDPIVPPEHGDAYVRRVSAMGQRVTHVRVPGAAHFEVVAAGAPGRAPSAAWAEVAATVEAFLGEIAGPRGPR